MMDLETINYVNERDSDNRLAEVRGESKVARFFVYDDDPDRGVIYLQLAAGESRSFHYNGDHEEGWWSHSETYEFDGESVFQYIHSDGTDCDGRLERFHEASCPFNLLSTRVGQWNGKPDPLAPRMPEWEQGARSQRDHTAEAAGY